MCIIYIYLQQDIKDLKPYFKELDCHLLPHPGRDVELKGFRGDRCDMKPQFISLFYHYFKSLISRKCFTPKFRDSLELLDVFGRMCDSTLDGDISNDDIFHEMLVNYKNNNKYIQYNAV